MALIHNHMGKRYFHFECMRDTPNELSHHQWRNQLHTTHMLGNESQIE